jgi:hypothetical protein
MHNEPSRRAARDVLVDALIIQADNHEGFRVACEAGWDWELFHFDGGSSIPCITRLSHLSFSEQMCTCYTEGGA